MVRVQLSYLEEAEDRLLSVSARIDKGRWRISQPLPPAARRGGHAYVLFTGYEPALIRGEMRSYAVSAER